MNHRQRAIREAFEADFFLPDDAMFSLTFVVDRWSFATNDKRTPAVDATAQNYFTHVGHNDGGFPL
jgi:hypothetical protein